jgi:zinc/manganese transport system permease protein
VRIVTTFFANFQFFIQSLQEFEFLRQALWINLITGLVTAPLGVYLVLRRMSLMGDALSHALLPGVAVSYFFFGLSVPAMTIGGFLTGSLIVVLTVWAQQHSPLKEDSNFAAFYLLSLSIGVLAISLRGNSVDLMHILFGSPLTATTESLITTLVVCSLVAILFWLFRRFFLLEIFDPTYLASRGYHPVALQIFFLILVVACLVVSFQTNGTLLAMGQLILPGIIGRLWSQRIRTILWVAMVVSSLGSAAGLWLSFQMDWPLGPSTLLLWGSIYVVSLILNPQQGLLKTLFPRKHYES